MCALCSPYPVEVRSALRTTYEDWPCQFAVNDDGVPHCTKAHQLNPFGVAENGVCEDFKTDVGYVHFCVYVCAD